MSGQKTKNPSMKDTRSEKILSEIISILRRALEEKKCQVFLFGSRAEGHAAQASDVDIAVAAAEGIDNELSLARELLENSNIPLSVDLVDLSRAPQKLARRVRERGIPLWSN